MPLDERSLRKPTFDESMSVPVLMPCGQTFYVPKPVLYLEPVFQNGLPTSGTRLATDDPELDRLKETIQQAVDATGGPDFAFEQATIGLAAYMLRSNYNLTDADLGRIFRMPASGEETASNWIGDILGVANGRSPKPSAVG